LNILDIWLECAEAKATIRSCAMAVRRNDRARPACLLVVDGDPQRAASTTHALRSLSTRALKVTIVSKAADALKVISRESVRAVLVAHRPTAGASEQNLSVVVESACGRPVVWLIEDDAVVEVAEAVAAGVSGAFYWDQLGPELLSVIDRLALGTSSDPASVPTGALLRKTGTRRRDPVSADGALFRA
jgi:DNA-binding NarL/FixJ family response regulator